MIFDSLSSNIYISTLIVSFCIQIIFFTFAAWKKTDKVTDLSYGLTFILLSLYSYIIYSQQYLFQTLVVIMISLWGLRLSTYLFIRILKTKKDKRFDGIRENYVKFAQFWSLQALSVWVISLPATYLLRQQENKDFALSMLLGLIIWLSGLIIETIADWQKYKFKNKSKNKNLWIESGLWKYSRHPNYYGEILCWWGIFIFTLPFLNQLGWLTIIGPIFITYIIIFVSGIPTLEKKYDQRYKNNKKYQQYKKTTSPLIILPKLSS